MPRKAIIQKQITSQTSVRLRNVLPLLVLLVALYVIVPRFSSFRASWHVLQTARLGFVAVALLAVAGAHFTGAWVYWRLVYRPIMYWPMVVVQVASSFTNRLLPAGTGAMATSAAHLMRRGHTVAQAGSVAALNNVLGFIGNMLLVGIVALLHTGGFDMQSVARTAIWLILAACVLGVLAVAAGRRWVYLRRTVRDGISEVRRILARPGHVVSALLASMVTTLCFATAFYFSAHALLIPLTAVQALYIMTAGVAVGAVTPLPGGLGGVEAGLVAAMIAVNVSPAPALAAALLYRLISYWLPIVPGFICFQIALKARYI